MKRIVTAVCLWLTAIGVLISLFAPTGPITQVASVVAIGGFVLIVAMSVIESIGMLRADQPEDQPKRAGRRAARARRECSADDDGWEDDLVDGTGMGLIDWND